MLVAAASALMTVFPLVWMLVIAFKTGGRGVHAEPAAGSADDCDNFLYVLTEVPFLRYLFNSFFVSATVTIAALFFHSMAGYALARLRFPGRETIFLVMFSTFLVSLPVIIVPLFILTRAMGMLDSYAGLIIPAIFNAFGIFLLRQYYLALPQGAGGSGDHRRRRLLAHLLERHPAAQPADPVGAGDPVLPRQLERLPVATDRHLRPQSVGRAGGDRQLQEPVLRRLELRHGRLDHRRRADARPVRDLPAADHGFHQDQRPQMSADMMRDQGETHEQCRPLTAARASQIARRQDPAVFELRPHRRQ